MWPFKSKDKEPAEDSDPGRFQRVLSILDPAEVEALGGLPFAAVAGEFVKSSSDSTTQSEASGAASSVSNFQPNPVFSAFMHHVIRTYGPEDEALQEAAEEQGSGFLYLIDLRTPDGVMGDVPPEDIVGMFAVEDGRLGEYTPSEYHLPYTKNGMVELPPSLAELHLRELKRLKFE